MRAVVAVGLVAPLLLAAGPPARPGAAPRPSVLLVTVDTLRADRLSCHGYARATTPRLDRLFATGVRFAQARTVEPLTAPALTSLLTSRHPHDHGATRNGLRVRPGLTSLPKLLQARGYRTAAFVSNWTLRHKISGLAEHFEVYREVLSRKRWLGLVSSEAAGDEVNGEALAWLEGHAAGAPGQPFLLWVHYIEPHAPYRLQTRHLAALGLNRRGNVAAADRYDTEVAEVDRLVGELLDAVGRTVPAAPLVVAFTADHGESLGEHDYWGHGRRLDETGLHVPMALVWSGRIAPQVIEAPALNIDIAPTLASLLGLPRPQGFDGHDWTAVLDGEPAPAGRVTNHQTHRAAVLSGHESRASRRNGLLEVALIQGGRKEVLRVAGNRARVFDLRADPLERVDLAAPRTPPSEALQEWVDLVRAGLGRRDEDAPQPVLDTESVRRLKALGYSD